MKQITELRRILLAGTPVERAKRAARMGTTPAYVEKLAGAYSLPSVEMLDRMRKLHPELTMDLIMAARKERKRLQAHLYGSHAVAKQQHR